MLKPLRIVAIVLSLIVCFGHTDLSASESKTIFLVRHAEKATDGSKNPHLTSLGQKRAAHIASLLEQQNIQSIFSTDYHRTQETAKPLANALKQEVKSYNPRDLQAFADELKLLKHNSLVVGHSNTTPQLVRFLGGNSHGEIDESDYNRLYKLIIAGDSVKTELTMIRVKDFE